MHKILAATLIATALAGCTTTRNFEPLLRVEPEPLPNAVIVYERPLLGVPVDRYHLYPPLPPRRPYDLDRRPMHHSQPPLPPRRPHDIGREHHRRDRE